ncbi:hypothetical protein HY641_01240 [Candidatus Woesearchaeota archaeon]|nr:hypothetical protein [Candidatus Woesearchaeota archaeon]
MRHHWTLFVLAVLVVSLLAPVAFAKGSMRAVRALAVAEHADAPMKKVVNPYAIQPVQKQARARVLNVRGSVSNPLLLGCTKENCPTSSRFEQVSRDYKRPPVLGPRQFGSRLGGAFARR